MITHGPPDVTLPRETTDDRRATAWGFTPHISATEAALLCNLWVIAHG